MSEGQTINIETAVRERYSAAALKRESALCCAVAYDRSLLRIIPHEVIEKDYGCGDPSRHVKRGETVLDLGSGAGKLCFIAAQVVGPSGRVIGLDMTDPMLEVARRNAPIVAERLGYANVEFKKGRIQDLALDLERLEFELKVRPVNNVETYLTMEEFARDLRIRSPLVESDSIDVVVSNCVLNLVEPRAKRQLFHEIYRVLKIGGRAVISDIAANRSVPERLQNDPRLWSGCISGALTESELLESFNRVGFNGTRILSRTDEPWETVEEIEFRSVTVEAYKGKLLSAGSTACCEGDKGRCC
jgi:arsenite methyltransferase